MYDTATYVSDKAHMIQILIYIIKRKKQLKMKTYKDASTHQIKKNSKQNEGETWELGRYQDKMIENEGEWLLRGVWISLHSDQKF